MRYLDYISAQQPIVWRIPDNVSFEQAAALGGIPGDVSYYILPMEHFLNLILLQDRCASPVYSPEYFQTLVVSH